MVVDGVNIGAVSAKTFIMDEKEILGYCILSAGYDIPKRDKEVAILAWISPMVYPKNR